MSLYYLGTVLGMLIFLIYISDITDFNLDFADDHLLHHSYYQNKARFLLLQKNLDVFYLSGAVSYLADEVQLHCYEGPIIFYRQVAIPYNV